MKLKVVHCKDHDHKVVYLDDALVISNDYSVENVYRIAKYLKWEIETVMLTMEEFEEQFS